MQKVADGHEQVKIQIMGAPRDNALAKDSAWVSDREVNVKAWRSHFNSELAAPASLSRTPCRQPRA